eukprot:CAMPEP_0168477504 /NCGR_PEP_ID=MMETSP0228-20121227/62448_1 /TAXON_ID=133427 /ORGANISM="Protoceratium reticulatum, Strain CCCM 535 (=CCMP 1889)" /LENGTH=37 /DNA_ID= /DNA_START= /DNA_END= /DNA_ORIENTATION=
MTVREATCVATAAGDRVWQPPSGLVPQLLLLEVPAAA